MNYRYLVNSFSMSTVSLSSVYFLVPASSGSSEVAISIFRAQALEHCLRTLRPFSAVERPDNSMGVSRDANSTFWSCAMWQTNSPLSTASILMVPVAFR